jgi:hypothetical protein
MMAKGRACVGGSKDTAFRPAGPAAFAEAHHEPERGQAGSGLACLDESTLLDRIGQPGKQAGSQERLVARAIGPDVR